MNNIKTIPRQFVLKALALVTITLFMAPVLAGVAVAQTGKTNCDNVTTTAKIQDCLKNNPVSEKLRLIVNALSAGVGVVVVAMIIVGGIQYIMAGDNPNATAEAKKRITNALIALVAFLFVGAFLQWLVPGGLFN